LGKRRREKDEDAGLLLLCAAAARCLMWVDSRQIFSVNMPTINEVDEIIESLVFVLAAVRPTSDIGSVYNLLREYPPAITGLINYIQPNTSTDTS